MELFRFIAWQYRRFDFEELSLILSSLVAISAGFICSYLGISFIGLIAGIVLSFFATLCFCALIYHARSQWWKYKRERDQEAQKIVDRLRGTRNGVGTNC